MGKKLRGAALRAKKRQQEAMEEMQEQQAADVAAAAVVDQPDERLFVLDTEGSLLPHLPKAETILKKKAARTVKVLTAKEKVEVERLLQKHSKRELVQMVQQGKALLDPKRVLRTHGARSDGKKKANYDLWGDDDDDNNGNDKAKPDKKQASDAAKAQSSSMRSTLGSAPAGISPGHVQYKGRKARLPPALAAAGGGSITSTTRTPSTTVAVEVAQSGQSYRPDPTLHKRALEKALAVETRRQQAQEYQNTPISQGMSEETKALIVGDTDSEDESSDDDNNNDEDETTTTTTSALHKRKDKFTRAQRNKQKRLRVEKAIQGKARKRRKLENQVAEIPRYKKEFRKESQVLSTRKDEIAAAKEASSRVKGAKVFEAASESNPIEAPTYPIGLTAEVKKATLRTIRPKGSLVTDRIMSLRDREMAAPVKGHKTLKKRKRRKAVKGKHNAGNEGADFAVLG